jgi:tetratricopeptide (TPR) repeat protein
MRLTDGTLRLRAARVKRHAMADSGDEATPERLIEVLADLGELDAGVEVLDALRLRVPASTSLIRLQARLFMAAPASTEQARAAMAAWCNGALDRLARDGAVRECAVGYRVLAKTFSDDRVWRDRSVRLDAALTPLPNPYNDGARTAIDALVARGAIAEAADALRALARLEPHDADLAQRAGIFEELCAENTDTRAYEVVAPPTVSAPKDVALLAASVQRAVRGGDLRGALADAAALSEHAGSNPRWERFRSALQRLVAWSAAITPSAGDEEVTQRTGPIERADLWLRAGDLAQAREAIRTQLAKTADPELLSALSSRLADLDIVLDGTLPTPIPARPSTALPHTLPAIPPTPAPPQIVLAEPPLAPVTPPRVTPAPELQGTEDTSPARPPVASPEHRPSQPPVTGDVKVGKRKIVRLT